MAGRQDSPIVPRKHVYSVRKSRGFTMINVMNCSFTWRLDNFTFFPFDVGESISSPEFPSGPHGELKWRLVLYPQGEDETSKDYISLILELSALRKPMLDSPILAKYKCSVMNSGNEEVYKGQSEKYFSLHDQDGWARFLCRDYMLSEENDLLSDGSLRIHCEVAAYTSKYAIGEEERSVEVMASEYALLQDLAAMFNTKTNQNDIVICVDGKRFPAHKAILAARSPVFAAMFEHELVEVKKNWVEITDFDSDVIDEMLRFIYSGNVKNLRMKSAVFISSLLAASDKYAIESLKTECEKALIAVLNGANVSDILLLADLHNAGRLKKECTEFISNRVHSILHSPNWSRRVNRQPQELVDLFELLSTKRSPTVDREFLEVNATT